MLSKNLFDEKTLEVNSISDYLTVTTPLPQYLPYPRFLLDTDLSHTAKLLYTLLLDRATLSQKNNWIDAQGRIYVILHRPSVSVPQGGVKRCVTPTTHIFFPAF